MMVEVDPIVVELRAAPAHLSPQVQAQLDRIEAMLKRILGEPVEGHDVRVKE